ncbi:oxidoreductase C-terminal domain-containing protein [Streptomyces sp. NPDC056600]|uniref:oxidoreductase C-terminal domain-containing protein n=1 Tax=Streptomyces sp. NPDC056600 TaxID=3345874 RepID=UPI00367C6EF9
MALRGDARGQVRVAELDGGQRLPADLVAVGVAVLPNAELAAAAALRVGDGIVVDEYLRTSDSAIHAIGDCARFPSPHTGRHPRPESVQNAANQARTVAAAICRQPERYPAVPWYWTEQYELRLHIAGNTTGHDRTEAAGDAAEDRFSVFCFHAGRLVGVEPVNRPADHMISRRLPAGDTDLTPEEATTAPGFGLKTRTRRPQTA